MVSIKKSTYLYEYIIHVFPKKSIIYADFEVVFLFQSVKSKKTITALRETRRLKFKKSDYTLKPYQSQNYPRKNFPK